MASGAGDDSGGLLPRQVRTLPADLAVVLAVVIVANLAVVLPIVRGTAVRIVVGLPFVLFVPGYAVVAALFPERSTDGSDREVATTGRSIDGVERVTLSFGLSVAVVPLIGLFLNFTPFGIRLAPILVSVSVLTVVSTAVAAYRRRSLPTDERFRVPYRQWIDSIRAELFDPDDRIDGILNVLMVVSMLLALTSVGYALAVPKQGETFTETYLLTETDNGDLIADGYPTNFTIGESKPIVYGVTNQEHTTVDYTVVVELQNVSSVDNETRVHRTAQLQQFHIRLAHNESWTRQHTVTPPFTGNDLRLVYLLYKDDPPADPSFESAYRAVFTWVNVTAPSSE